ncbi:hypothetical protein BDN71DRAFT_1512429 [Pleurotus eryngii]|uniref:Uncharacterized protein n=1 Tax=Pleurotus eryngii TaxID=5323 RepID=A0A9P5ZIZ5_PLEER|nr:hypothetical protein BDN71DRAFT_1512429 [Pleurotus eryngii]
MTDRATAIITEIEAKWLITRTLSTLKEKTDELIREFFDNPCTKTARAVAEAAQELRKRQQSEAEAEDAMEVEGTGPSGMPKAPAPKEKVATALKRRNVEDHEGRKRRSPTVNEEVMKVVKKEEFDALIRPRIETLDEAMRRRMEKGKGKAMDLATSGAGKATDEITVHKIVAPKKRATAKLKSMVGSETDEPRRRPEPSSDEGEEFPELSNDDEESDSGKRRNPRRQAKPRKGSMALPKVEIVERNMHGMTHLPSLGPQANQRAWQETLSAPAEGADKRRQRDEVPLMPAKWQVFVQETNRRMDDMAQQIGDLGREVNKRARSKWLGRHGRLGRTKERTGISGSGLNIQENIEPAEPAPPAPASLPPPLPDMPPPPPTVAPPCTPPPAPHHPLSPSQAPASPSTPPPHSPSPTHSLSLPHELPTASSVPAPSQTRAASEDVNMDLASSPAAAAPIVTVQEPTPCSNTALANLSHALAQLQVPPPRMTRARSATPTETVRRSTRSTSRTPAPDDSKAAKRKATSGAVTNTKRLKK